MGEVDITDVHFSTKLEYISRSVETGKYVYLVLSSIGEWIYHFERWTANAAMVEKKYEELMFVNNR